MNQTVQINPNEIPDTVYQTACRILNTSVRRFFALPGVKEKYDEWMKTEEGQLAALSPEERSQKRLKSAK